jgi:catechol 2,3-dioxygenase-like lactoylglutathione lyase family enzyme
MKLGRTTPILRIFDVAKAREFYVDRLGFQVDWEELDPFGNRMIFFERKR